MFFTDIAYASETAEAAVEGAEQGLFASLGINGTAFVFQLINFAIVAAILWFLILKPLTKKMAERQKLIDDSLDNAKKVDENLRVSEQKYQQRVDEAKVEYNKILEKASKDADALSGELKDKAKKEIEQLVEQAKKNINIERDEMVADLRKETANLIVSALEKILSEKMTGEKDKKLIEEMIGKIK